MVRVWCQTNAYTVKIGSPSCQNKSQTLKELEEKSVVLLEGHGHPPWGSLQIPLL